MNTDPNESIDDLLDVDANRHPFALPLGELTMRGQRVLDGPYHITGVSVWQGDDVLYVGKGNATDGKVIERDPSIRGSIVSVELTNESGVMMGVRLRFHKGEVYIGADYGDELLPPEEIGEYLSINEFWRD